MMSDLELVLDAYSRATGVSNLTVVGLILGHLYNDGRVDLGLVDKLTTALGVELEPCRTFEAEVKTCGRCGGRHDSVTFRDFRRPADFAHWGACPVSGDPIVVAYTPGPGLGRVPVGVQA